MDPSDDVSTGTVKVMVFRPTMEEFRDFPAYLRTIEMAGAHDMCGVCKIIPPKEWHPRPSRGNDYSDADTYMIDSPIKEKIHGASGCYTKYNTVYKKSMSVEEFRKMATSSKYAPPVYDSIQEMERNYWRNVTYQQAIYGADTPGSFYDSGVKEWNINNLGTILDLIDKEGIEIKGVNTAYLYFGMWKATFPWHTEDMDLYSINYLHFGADKFWYGISAREADRFETLAATFFPQSARECKAFLRHKMHMISPHILKKHNIPYGTMVQRAGEFMFTFPRGYHAGFNCGYNLAESTNFASDRWIDYGKKAVLCSCTEDTVKINMVPFMQKYRPDEFGEWYDYWYEDQPVASINAKKKGCRSKRNPVRPDPNAKTAKRRKAAQRSASLVGMETEDDDDEEYSPIVMDRPPRSPSPTKEEVKNKKKDEEWKKPLDKLWQWKIPCFEAERRFNQSQSLMEPHCAVCQYFVSTSLCHQSSAVPKRSRKLVSQLCFTRDPSTALGDMGEEDRLITCVSCQVTVHAQCYGVGENDGGKKWRCNRCEDDQKETAECRMCQLRGGALKAVSDYGFAHIICALYNSLANFPDPVTKHPIKLNPPNDPEESSEGYHCELCGSDIGYTIACVLCPNSPACFHATCARFAGVSFEFKDWPVLVAAVCPKHNWGPHTDGLAPIEMGEEVVAWLEQGIRVRKGEVVSKREDTFCVVDFDDGSMSSDLYLEDITECSCAKLGCQGAHTSGAHVTVKWPGGERFEGTYRRAHKGTTYTVYIPTERSNVECSREELYGKEDVVPDVVQDRL